jgi:hypothetical protein
MLEKDNLQALVTAGPVLHLNLFDSIEAIRRGEFTLKDLEDLVTPRLPDPKEKELTLPIPRFLQNLYRLDSRLRETFIDEVRTVVSPSHTTITRFHAVRSCAESLGILAEIFQEGRDWDALNAELIQCISLDMNRIGYQLFNNYEVYLDFLDASEKATTYRWVEASSNSFEATPKKNGQALRWLLESGEAGGGQVVAALVDGFDQNYRTSLLAAGEIVDQFPMTISALRLALKHANHRIVLQNAVDILRPVTHPAAAAICLDQSESTLYTCCTADISVSILNNDRFRVIRNQDPFFNQRLGTLSLRDRDLLIDTATAGPRSAILVCTEGIQNALDPDEIRVILSLKFPVNIITNLIVNAARFRNMLNSWGSPDMMAFVLRRK